MKKQAGNVVEWVILGVVVVGVTALIIWRYIAVNQTLDNTNQSLTTSDTLTSKKTETKTTTEETSAAKTAEPKPEIYSAEYITSHVQSTYSVYIELRKKGTSVQQSLQSVSGAFDTATFTALSNTTGQEGLTCAVNYIPDSVTITTSISGNQASSIITRIREGQTASSKITVISNITTGQITGVKCP